MTFRHTIERDGGETHELTVRAEVMPFADACGVPREFSSRFDGCHEVTLEITDDATGAPFVVTDDEWQTLREQAIERRFDD